MDPAAVERGVAAHGLEGGLGRPPGSLAPLDDEGWDRLLARVSHDRLTGLLVEAIDDGAVEADERQVRAAADLHRVALTADLQLERLLVETTDLLADLGVETRVLKGPATAHLDYPDPSLRSFADIDLLVRSEDLAQVVSTLTDRGHRRRYPEPRPGFDARFGKSVTLVAPGGRELDLHRTLAMGPFGLMVRLDQLWAGAQAFPLAGRTMRALPDASRFLHACYHAALGNTPPRLVPLRDVAQMALGGTVALEPVLELANDWRGEAVVARAVRSAWEVLGLTTEVPLFEWAHRHEASASERRALRAYAEGGRTFAAKAMAGLRAVPGLRSKVAYATALAFPRRSYLDGRHGDRRSRWRTGLRDLRRQRAGT